MNETDPIARTRVLHIITRLIVGGAQENTLYSAEMMDPGLYQVEVVSGPQTGSEGSLIEEAQERGISLTILDDLHREINPLLDLVALWKLTRLIRNGKYAIVHTHSSKAGIIGRIAARVSGVPVIIHTVHGWSFHDFMNPIFQKIYIQLEKWMASFSDALIVVGKSDQVKGLKKGIGSPDKYHIIRSAIPVNEFDPAKYDRSAERSNLGIPLNAVVIGNVGRFSAQKNPLDWIKVAGIVGRACPEAFFLLVGDGPLRSKISEQICIERLTERVILTGLRRDVPRLFAAMDVFMLTSLWEGLPRVIPQAMAMKLPILANRADGTIEAVQDGITGFLCGPGDVEQMAAYCIRLVKEAQLREQMGCKGQAFARDEFDLEKMITEIDRLYQKLIG